MFKRVLLAADGSEHSIRAAKKAIQLVANSSKTVDVVFVISDKDSKKDVLHNRSKYEIKESRRERLKKLRNCFLLIKRNIQSTS
ncbi:universal stress protein [Halalkalibacter urbisdiaboli]|uniref:universal stress protein n=1 Tax=Halalkalibacter urbisdiaboli TaxID=1960589 RepID=UPI00315AB3C3